MAFMQRRLLVLSCQRYIIPGRCMGDMTLGGEAQVGRYL